MRKKVHISGIGGIGTSAIAQWLLDLGFTVTGSDIAASTITTQLEALGIPIQYNQTELPPEDTNTLIYSDAVPADDRERQWALQHSIPQYSYATYLGILTSSYHTIAISGSHGKSTTTALTGLLLAELGYDPTVVVGTLVNEWSRKNRLGNYRPGTKRYCVVEADEYRNHFLELHPAVAVVTSLDHDHVDAFPTPSAYKQAFINFINHMRSPRMLVLEGGVYEALLHDLPHVPLTLYALAAPSSVPSGATVLSVSNRVWRGDQHHFDVVLDAARWEAFTLPLPGEHMVANALAAIGVGLAVAEKSAVEAAARRVLNNFTGVWRRFERIGSIRGAPVFSDYAHHPTEVAAVIAACHEAYPSRRLVFVFQPHHLERARTFADDFIQIFEKSLHEHERLVLCDVYNVAGREENDRVVSTERWAKTIGLKADYVADNTQLKNRLYQLVGDSDIVIFAGAGSIDATARQIVNPLPV